MKNPKFPFPLQIILAVILGAITGKCLGGSSQIFGQLGLLLIQLLKTLATPLIFFAIVDAFCKTPVTLKKGLKLFCLSGVNACVAGGIAVLVSSFVSISDPSVFLQFLKNEPGSTGSTAPQLDIWKAMNGVIPQSIVDPWINNNVISIVVIAIAIGIALRKLSSKNSTKSLAKSLDGNEDVAVWIKFFSGGFQIISMLLGWTVKAVPIAVFGVIAKAVGTNGWGIFSVLTTFVLMIAAGIFAHVFIYYSLLLFGFGGISPLQFFKKGTEALLTALGTGSSLATLPVTLRTLQDKMKVSAESSRLAACVGTNFNHDGILLYEAATALFVAKLIGVHFGFSQIVILLGTSALAAIGIAGVPDAGLITLSLVLSAVGLPLSFVPIFITVDWLIGRLRAMTNVTSDMVVATLLDRWK